jgi:cupin fold WbuC family metalloprotein
MQMKKVADEVLYPDEPLVRVDRAEVERLKEAARRTARGRMRLCAHPEASDRLHEMLIVHPRDAYVRPHRHIGKSESMNVLEGTCTLVFFDDGGRVTESVDMGDYRSGRCFYYRSAEERWHSLLITSDVLVFTEATNGPFVREENRPAPWSPAAEDAEGVRRFLDRVRAETSAIASSHGVPEARR